MNKQDLAAQVAEDAGVSRETASMVIEAMLGQITAALVRGEDVRLVGFGNFVLGERKASMGRNPRTGEPMDLAPCRTPKFRVGRNLKDACNRSGRAQKL